jgi:signal transduction histidine kinase
VGQTLTLLVSGLRSASEESSVENVRRRSEELHDLAQRALKDARQLALGLRPSLLDDLGLCSAMERILTEVRDHHGLKVDLNASGRCRERLPEAVETALFRIFQEAISNVVQHSHATEVIARLAREDDSISLQVEDNGCGIDPQRLHDRSPFDGHLGLVGMAERAGLQRGRLMIDSTPGQGTRVDVRIPLERIHAQDSRHAG